MSVTITRTSTGDDGTTGELLVESDDGGSFTCNTMELPWRENRPGRSCIPPGIYRCAFTWSPGLRRWCYLVDGVEGRSGIRIHSGNYGGDVALGKRSHIQGCILLGGYYATVKGQLGIFESVTAVREFEDFIGEKEFDLEIVEG